MIDRILLIAFAFTSSAVAADYVPEAPAWATVEEARAEAWLETGAYRNAMDEASSTCGGEVTILRSIASETEDGFGMRLWFLCGMQ